MRCHSSNQFSIPFALRQGEDLFFSDVQVLTRCGTYTAQYSLPLKMKRKEVDEQFFFFSQFRIFCLFRQCKKQFGSRAIGFFSLFGCRNVWSNDADSPSADFAVYAFQLLFTPFSAIKSLVGAMRVNAEYADNCLSGFEASSGYGAGLGNRTQYVFHV